MIQPNINVSALNIDVLVAEEFFKFQTIFNKKSDSNIIDVRKSADGIFAVKLEKHHIIQ